MRAGFASNLRQQFFAAGWTIAVSGRYNGAVARGAAQQGCLRRCSVTTNTFELPPCRAVVPAEVVQVLSARLPTAPDLKGAAPEKDTFWRDIDFSICNY